MQSDIQADGWTLIIGQTGGVLDRWTNTPNFMEAGGTEAFEGRKTVWKPKRLKKWEKWEKSLEAESRRICEIPTELR